MEKHFPYMSDDKVDTILDFAQSAEFLKSPLCGGSAFYLPFNDEYGVLYSNIFRNKKGVKPKELSDVVDEVYKLYQQGNKVAPIVGFAYEKDQNKQTNKNYSKDIRDYVIVKRAPGLRLSNVADSNPVAKVQERLNRPSIHYDKVVDTFSNLLGAEIEVDVKSHNILQHPVSGYNFIDFTRKLTKANKGVDYPKLMISKFLYTFSFLENYEQKMRNSNFREEIEEFVKFSRKEILGLMERLHERGFNDSQITYGAEKIQSKYKDFGFKI